MADHSPNQRADSAVFADDDPFAELTRIMGHDPRRAEDSGNAAGQEGDDLALELENELLGDLAEFSDEVREEPAEDHSRPEMQTQDWRFEAPPAAEEPGVVEQEPEVDLASDMANELDETFAASFESEMRLEPVEEAVSADISASPAASMAEPEPSFEPSMEGAPAAAAPEPEQVSQHDAFAAPEAPEARQGHEAPPAFDPHDIEQHFSEFDIDASAREFASFAAEEQQPIEESAPEPAEEPVVTFDESDFAQLDNDLEASLAADNWQDGIASSKPVETQAADTHYADAQPIDTQALDTGALDTGAMAGQPEQPVEAEAASSADRFGAAVEDEDMFPEPDAWASMPSEDTDTADAVAGDVASTFSEIDVPPATDISAALADAVRVSGGADPYLSPQAFANSVAQGAEKSGTVDADMAGDDHDFAASLEQQLTAGALAEEEVAEPVMEPQREPTPETSFDWGDLDFGAPEALQSVETHEPVAPEATETTPASSIPFWQQPEEPQPNVSYGGGSEASTPFIDTVDVPGNERVPVTDSAHIPEFVSEPEHAPAAEADDLELALARAFGDSESLPERADTRSAVEETPASSIPRDAYAAAALEGDEPRRPQDDFDFETAFADSFAETGEFDDDFAAGRDAGAAVSGRAEVADGFAPAMTPWDEPVDEFTPAEQAAAPAAAAAAAAASRSNPLKSRRNTLIAAAVGGVAVVGAIAFFALGSGGGDDNTAPAVVRADNDPVKVKPENPGGQQVPNQDNQVYQRVTGGETDSDPAQERLVSTAEEPVEVPLAAPKSEERLDPNAGDTAAPTSEPVTAMTPRRVRTMVVRPDGTIVPREPEAPVQTATETAGAPAATGNAQEVAPDARLAAAGENAPASGTAQTGAGETAAAPNVQAPVPTSRPAAPAAPQQPAAQQQSSQVAAAPSQPTQPVAQAPAPAPVTTGTDGWSVQISSQPTVEAAQKSYQDMAQRYGNLLTGKGVNIVKAEIAGKGTYYRVRIPSSSKDDAIRLCSQLKSAGGSCFVSK
ncbi:SPOR domain-containing protein [Nitratireductor aquimarinus]|uniref:SPOR domain-containing protein n=1 Tax=Nitratireductor aquimarinus TaxID=889300 RepID=UPI001A90391D|nr:SPOR domain-containing protein [Nitratireductor aquimarinus]MBN8244467.1 SPOR domain-containing protein [Nitratireductor aquimarinus]MBY6132855.1 SPOR domain-containing protein [Nitratireductor aquimarinus]MCA1301699.1 SPOR domain-containing protein [Nitratireductor aquimarinus]